MIKDVAVLSPLYVTIFWGIVLIANSPKCKPKFLLGIFMFVALMEKGWVLIFTTNNHQQAEIIKALLNQNEIMAVNLNKQSSVYLIGEIEIYVQSTDVIRAKQLISKQNEN